MPNWTQCASECSWGVEREGGRLQTGAQSPPGLWRCRRASAGRGKRAGWHRAGTTWKPPPVFRPFPHMLAWEPAGSPPPHLDGGHHRLQLRRGHVDVARLPFVRGGQIYEVQRRGTGLVPGRHEDQHLCATLISQGLGGLGWPRHWAHGWDSAGKPLAAAGWGSTWTRPAQSSRTDVPDKRPPTPLNPTPQATDPAPGRGGRGPGWRRGRAGSWRPCGGRGSVQGSPGCGLPAARGVQRAGS